MYQLTAWHLAPLLFHGSFCVIKDFCWRLYYNVLFRAMRFSRHRTIVCFHKWLSHTQISRRWWKFCLNTLLAQLKYFLFANILDSFSIMLSTCSLTRYTILFHCFISHIVLAWVLFSRKQAGISFKSLILMLDKMCVILIKIILHIIIRMKN